MKTKSDKRSWLLGRWEIESKDSSPVFYITQKPSTGEVVVHAFDKYDGENFRVTKKASRSCITGRRGTPVRASRARSNGDKNRGRCVRTFPRRRAVQINRLRASSNWRSTSFTTGRMLAVPRFNRFHASISSVDGNGSPLKPSSRLCAKISAT